ncbi:unnamed protein product, partial [marine sediment metagenome]
KLTGENDSNGHDDFDPTHYFIASIAMDFWN